MTSVSYHQPSYPYASNAFISTAKNLLDQSPGIEKATEMDKRTAKQIEAVASSASFQNEGIYHQLLIFLEKIFKLGSQEALKDNQGDALSEKVNDALTDIYDAIELGTETAQPDAGTKVDQEEPPETGQKLYELSSDENSHGKGLVFNFLRDFALEHNFLSLGHQKDFKDSSGQTWSYSSASITGTHTKAVNSDSVTEARKDSSVLGAVADGVSRVPNPDDKEEYNQAKEEEYELTHEDGSTEKVNGETAMEEIEERNVWRFGSHHLAKICTEEISKVGSLKEQIQEIKPDRPLSAAAEDTLDTLKKDPKLFWNKIQNFIEDSIPTNFFTGFIENYQQNAGSLKDLFKDLPDLDQALTDRDLQEVLISLAPLYLSMNSIMNKFYEQLCQDDTSAAGGTQLAYALDLGERVALVRIGDTQIKALSSQGDEPTNLNEQSKKEENSGTGDIKIEYDSNTGYIASGIRGIPFVEILEKNKVDNILMSSDGLFGSSKGLNRANEKLHHFFSEAVVSSANSPKELVSSALAETREGSDDRTILVIKKSDNE